MLLSETSPSERIVLTHFEVLIGPQPDVSRVLASLGNTVEEAGILGGRWGDL
jgi:hypothetical protein